MVARRIRVASISNEWESSTGAMILMAHRGVFFPFTIYWSPLLRRTFMSMLLSC